MLERVSTASKPTWFPTDKCFIGGRWVAPASGARLPVEDPSRGTEIGEIARGTAADIDAAVEAAERALQGEWGAPDRDRARAALGETRRTGRLPRRRACPDRGARRRQAVEAGPRRRARAGPLHGVLRRRRRQGDGRNHPLPRRLYRLHVARAPWRDRAYRAVELSDADRRAHRRRGAGDGQRLCAEAGGGSLPDLARARRPRARGGFSATARSMSFRASARRPARRSPPTPASGIFPSPVRSRSGRWCRRRRRAMSRR